MDLPGKNKPTAKSAGAKPFMEAVAASDKVVSTEQAAASDTSAEVGKLREEFKKDIKDVRGEQRGIIIGAVIAVVLIVATVAVQAIYYNNTYNTALDEFKAQQKQDIDDLRNLIIQNQQNMNNALLSRPVAAPVPAP